jgi:hypothetical protein
MNISGRSILKLAVVFALALVGAALMIKLDHGGTVWLKFSLYSLFFIAIFLAAVFSPAQSRGCGWSFFRRQKKI